MQRNKMFRPERGKSLKKFNGRAHIDALYKDPRWVDLSKRFLEANKKCFCCGKKSEVTDHMKAHKGDTVLFTQMDNLLPFCVKCHNTVTAKFDRGPVQRFEDKMRWIFSMRSKYDLSFKVYVINTYVISEGENNDNG